MNENKICDMVQDLLPMYIEGLTGEGSNAQIREHIETCEDCRKVWEDMRTPEPQTQETTQTEAAEIDFFRKTKRRGLRNVLIVAMAALAVVLIVFAGVFGRKKLMRPEEFTAEVTVTENGSVSEVYIEGKLIDGYRIREYRFSEDENGSVHIELLGSRTLRYGIDQEFGSGDSLTVPPKQVWVAGQLVWEEGERIPEYVSNALAAKTPYIGDNVAVGNLLQTLEVYKTLGTISMRLQTAAEPYGLTVELGDRLDPLLQEYAEVKMKGYACMLLALVDNLGEASFEYTLNDGTDQVHRVTVTTADAKELAGMNIKEAASSAVSLKKVMVRLGLVDDYTA